MPRIERIVETPKIWKFPGRKKREKGRKKIEYLQGR